ASTTMNSYGNLDITSLLQWMVDNNMATHEWLFLWGQEIYDFTFKGLSRNTMAIDVLYNNIPNNNATLAYPTDAQVVKNLNQVLRINPATDPDNDTLRYNFVLSNSVGNIIQQSGWSSSLSMPI